MIQALLHNKLKDSFIDPHFKPSEDSLTSSVIGSMQYLPDTLFWALLRNSCGSKEKLPIDIGNILTFSFWERLLPDGKYNFSHVEPDVLVESDDYYIIIEAKKHDSLTQQEEYQWENEIVAFNKTYKENDKEIIFIALGGNLNLQDKYIEVSNKNYTIYCSSWYNLLLQINNCLDEGDLASSAQIRLLKDIVSVMAKHNYLAINWLEEMEQINIKQESRSNLASLWEFDNKNMLADLSLFRKNINPHLLSKTWNLK